MHLAVTRARAAVAVVAWVGDAVGILDVLMAIDPTNGIGVAKRAALLGAALGAFWFMRLGRFVF